MLSNSGAPFRRVELTLKVALLKISHLIGSRQTLHRLATRTGADGMLVPVKLIALEEFKGELTLF
jgi:hypothetical protein